MSPNFKDKVGLPIFCVIAGGLVSGCNPRAPEVEAENSQTHKFHILLHCLLTSPTSIRAAVISVKPSVDPNFTVSRSHPHKETAERVTGSNRL